MEHCARGTILSVDELTFVWNVRFYLLGSTQEAFLPVVLMFC